MLFVMMRLLLTLLITSLYCSVWVWLEKIIGGQVSDSAVDNIIMVLFVPIIYIATSVIAKWLGFNE